MKDLCILLLTNSLHAKSINTIQRSSPLADLKLFRDKCGRWVLDSYFKKEPTFKKKV